MSEELLVVSSSPHFEGNRTTTSLMRDVLIALIPTVIAANIIFGLRSLLLIAVTVASCVISEYVSRKIMRKPNAVYDLSAAVTGVLLALNYPVTLPLWMAAIGGIVAIVAVKQLFGGLGQNFANPALVGRIVVTVSFPAQMTNFVVPAIISGPDVITGVTPLAAAQGAGAMPSLMDLFLGLRAGCIGETSILALLLGGLYLFARRVIHPVIPVVYLGTTAILYAISGQDPLYFLMSGGLVLAAFFMATDYVTSPLTTKGKFFFAIGCGLLTFVIRQFGASPEGVSYSILLMNLFVPHIDKLTRPKPFGGERKNA